MCLSSGFACVRVEGDREIGKRMEQKKSQDSWLDSLVGWVSQLVGWLIGLYIGKLVGLYVGKLVGLYVGKLVGLYVGKLVG